MRAPVDLDLGATAAKTRTLQFIAFTSIPERPFRAAADIRGGGKPVLLLLSPLSCSF
jgi:hypothetical protein